MTTIKPFFLIMTVIVVLVWIPKLAHASDRDILQNKLIFLYVSNPNAQPRQAPQRLNNAAIARGVENEAFWSNTSVRGLHRLVRALLCDRQGGGDPSLQYYEARVIELQNKYVSVWLLDDVSQTLTSAASKNYDFCLDPRTSRAWPCATSYQNNATNAGRIALGAHFFRGIATGTPSSQELTTAFSTFLHESVHTQDNTDGRAHLFWPRGGYGMDEDHFGVEAMPNTASSFAEGIANAVELMYDAESELFIFRLLVGQNSLIWVERASPPPASGLSPDNWLYRQLQNAGIPEATLTAGERKWWQNAYGADFVKNYAPFRIQTLPARIVIKSEYVIALILAQYMQHVDPVRFYNAIRTVNQHLTQASGSGIAVLFEEMCRAGLPVGSTVADVSVSSSSTGPKSYLLPLAYADYFTGYRSGNNKNSFADVFEGMMPSEWIDLYWAHKDTVRAAARFDNNRTPQFADLTNIAVALGITKSIPD